MNFKSEVSTILKDYVFQMRHGSRVPINVVKGVVQAGGNLPSLEHFWLKRVKLGTTYAPA